MLYPSFSWWQAAQNSDFWKNPALTAFSCPFDYPGSAGGLPSAGGPNILPSRRWQETQVTPESLSLGSNPAFFFPLDVTSDCSASGAWQK